MFRPQFSFGTPAGYKDVPYVRPVTVGQDINVPIPSGQFVKDYVIRLDNDAPSIFRSLFVQGVQQDQSTQIQMQLRDAYGNYLTDGYIPLDLYAWGAGNTPPDGGSGRAKVFEPELYCPAGSVMIADFFNPGSPSVIPSFTPPSLQSLSHTATQMDEHSVGGQGQGAGVVSFGGALYQVLQWDGTPFPGGVGSINVLKSTDSGLTWAPLDAANSPTRNAIQPEPMAGVFYDGAGKYTVCATLGSVLAASAQPLYFQDFDLTTGLWSAAYGTAGAPNRYGVNQVQLRSDGSLLVITISALSGGGASALSADVFLGGAWSAFSVTAGLPVGWTTNAMSSTVYDPLTGTIHMFSIAFSAGPVKHQYYQQLLLTNSVAGFQDLTGFYSNCTAMGNPVIIGNTICWGCADTAITFGTIVVGTPLSAPVFTVAPAPGVNPSQPIPYGINPNTLEPTFATDGTLLWAVVCDNRNFAGLGRIWLSVTSGATPLTGWVGGVIYDDATAPIPLSGDFQYPTISLNGNSIYITFQNSVGQPTNYFLSASIGVGSASLPPNMELRGIKRYPVRCE